MNLVFLYDWLARQQWQRKCEEKDPEFDLNKAVQKVNKEILAVAEEKLDAVLLAAGITPVAAKSGGGQQGHKSSVGDKQAAANDQSLMRVEQAKKDLEKQKKELTARENALMKASEKQAKLSNFNKRKGNRGSHHDNGFEGDGHGYNHQFNKRGRYTNGNFGRR